MEEQRKQRKSLAQVEDEGKKPRNLESNGTRSDREPSVPA